MTGSDNSVLAWLGLAIAIVVLNDFGLGSFARYTLIAVIVLVALSHFSDLSRLGDQLTAGLRPPSSPQLPPMHHL